MLGYLVFPPGGVFREKRAFFLRGSLVELVCDTNCAVCVCVAAGQVLGLAQQHQVRVVNESTTIVFGVRPVACALFIDRFGYHVSAVKYCLSVHIGCGCIGRVIVRRYSSATTQSELWQLAMLELQHWKAWCTWAKDFMT